MIVDKKKHFPFFFPHDEKLSTDTEGGLSVADTFSGRGARKTSNFLVSRLPQTRRGALN
jgi:hypothetical protein